MDGTIGGLFLLVKGYLGWSGLGLSQASGENNSVDFSADLQIIGWKAQFGEGDFSDGRGCGLLPVSQVSGDFGWHTSFQSEMNDDHLLYRDPDYYWDAYIHA